MCGICGVINYKKAEFVNENLIKEMTNTLIHRGPDEEGYFIENNIGLGIRRLSIIDLEKGSQPIYNENRTIVCIQNGEIYNYREEKERLEKMGHGFYTNSDTEVIVHLYEEYKEEFVSYLRGMFAICIYDKNKNKVILARDRLGIKPLYYNLINNNLIFASEIKAILKYPDINKEIDLKAVDNYFTLLYIPSPQSIFKNIKKLEPAQILIYHNGNIKLIKYWQIELRNYLRKKEKEYQEELEHLLKDAIKSHLVSDVEVGCFLSGGVDSSTVTCIAAEFLPKIKTFSVSFDIPQFNEIKYARIVAKRFNTSHYEFNMDMNAVELLPKLVNYFDEPFADTSLIPTYLISEVARKYVKVVLSGDGGDELFGGYEWLRRQKFIDYYNMVFPKFNIKLDENIIKGTNLVSSIKRFLYDAYYPQQGYLRRTTCFNKEMKNNLYSNLLKNELLKDNKLPQEKYFEQLKDDDIYNKIMYTDLTLYLPDDILVKVDRMSMAHSLEVRPPLLDHKLVEFTLSIPVELKLKRLETKYILKKVMNKKLPRIILKQRKWGFIPPIGEWLRGDLNKFAKDILLDNKLVYFNTNYIKWLFSQHEEGNHDFSHQLFAILMFALWYEQRVECNRI